MQLKPRASKPQELVAEGKYINEILAIMSPILEGSTGDFSDLFGSIGIHQGGPKTAAGKRPVVLSPVAISLLRRVYTAQLEQRLAVGPAWQDHDLAFT